MAHKDGKSIGETAVALVMSIYGDEVFALPSDEQRDEVRRAMQESIGAAVDIARAGNDIEDRSRINAIVTAASSQLAASLIARAGVRKLRALQAANATALAAAAIGKAAA